jgi:lipopolysaccharide biosynthesis glycosyltransferase
VNQVYIGYDPRQPVSYTVCAHSVWENSTEPVSITRLQLDQLPLTRSGLTQFTFSRYLVPWLCNYQGTALFLDADMVVTGDISEVFRLANDECDIQVVKNAEKFEWASMMLFNNSRCWKLTPEILESAENLFKLEDWASVGTLPDEWNFCVGYDTPTETLPKLIHYTQGIPIWDQTAKCDYADIWHQARVHMMRSCTFTELMGTSVHIKKMEEAENA